MSDTEKRDAVLIHYRGFDHRKSVFKPSTAEYDMAERIVELEAAVERVRELHTLNRYGICKDCGTHKCNTLRALEATP